MGVNLPRDMKIAGFPWSAYKATLITFDGWAPATKFFHRKKQHFGSVANAAIAYHECFSRGLLARTTAGTVGLTEAGAAICLGRTFPRYDRSVADRVFDSFVERIAAYNADPNAVFTIDEVWVYGSYIRTEPTVGDIDGALVVSPKPGLSDHEMGVMADFMVQARPELFKDFVYPLSPAAILERMIFGRNKHPLLIGIAPHPDNLRALHVPCKRVYDRLQNGRVEEDVVPAFPGSIRREPDIKPPLRLADLSPRKIAPLDLRWLTGHQPSIWPHFPFDDATDLLPQRLDDRQPQSIAIAYDSDGAGRIDLTDSVEETAILITRDIDFRRDVFVYDITAFAESRNISDNHFGIATALLALIVGTDLEFIIRRCRETGSLARVLLNAGPQIPDRAWLALHVEAIDLLRQNLDRLVPSMTERDDLLFNVRGHPLKALASSS